MTIAFVDCETTHLDAEIGEAWEVAVILREQDGDQTTDTEYVWQFAIDPTSADPEALRIGRFHERHLVDPTWGAAWTGPGPIIPLSRESAIEAIVHVLSGAVLVGSNPAFDDRFLRKLLGPGSAQWHYRPYDIVQLAATRFGAQAAGPLPWSSYALSRAVGVEPPTEEAAHTALGDARWARDVHDAVMIRQKFEPTTEDRARHAIGLYTQTAIELEDTRRDLREMRGSYERACTTIAAMHKAAVGDVRGPARGVVEDVEDVRQRADQIMKALHMYSHILRQRPGRQLATEYIRKQLDALIEHPEEICDLDQNEATIGRVRALLDERWLAAPHSSDDHDHLCPAVVRRAALDALDGPSRPLSAGETPCTCTLSESCGCNPGGIRTVNSPLSTKGLLVHESAVGLIDEIRSYSWDEEFEETGDSDSDVFALIAEIASRLRDATDEGEYHAVGLIYDLAETHKTVDEVRAELAEITFRHV